MDFAEWAEEWARGELEEWRRDLERGSVFLQFLQQMPRSQKDAADFLEPAWARDLAARISDLPETQ